MTGRRIPTLATQPRYWNQNAYEHPNWLGMSVAAGELDRDQLTQALHMVVARHESLRAIPEPDTDGEWQRILDPDDVPVRIYDIIGEDAQWRAIDTDPWPVGKARWVAGLIEQPYRKLVVKICHATTDEVGLRILEGDLGRAMAAVKSGNAPTWEPATQLSTVVDAETNAAGVNTLRRNADYFREMLTADWIIKPVVERQVRPAWIESTISVDMQCMRQFWSAADRIGVSWQTLLRAAFLRAEDVVHASGRVRLGSVHNNRRDRERRRCVANFAIHVPLIVDTRNAWDLDQDSWAHHVNAAIEAALDHLPAPQRNVVAWNSTAGTVFGRSVRRAPTYEIETGGNTFYSPAPAPGVGNRVSEVREGTRPINPTKLLLSRQTGEICLTLVDHTTRCSPGAMQLFAVGILAAIESYAGITDSPSIRRLHDARELRALCGRWPELELVDDTLAIVTPSRPALQQLGQ